MLARPDRTCSPPSISRAASRPVRSRRTASWISAPPRSRRARTRSARSRIWISTAHGRPRATTRTALRALPLRGMPVGLKDIYDTADMPTEYGSAAYKGHRPAADAASVTMLRRAGAVIIGKTVTTEFAHQQTGKTRNPHNLEHTPGGSSSGSAAAVGRRHGAGRDRLADRGFGDPPRRVLRRRGVQAVLQADPDHRGEMLRVVARHGRALRRRRRRRGVRDRRDDRPRPARRSRRAGGAARCVGAHAYLGRRERRHAESNRAGRARRSKPPARA